MAKYFMSSAKELAWKAYLDGFLFVSERELEDIDTDTQSNLRQRFENWWSDNFGNRDSTKFNPEYDVYVNGQRYIRAEADVKPSTIVSATSDTSMDCNTCSLAHCRVDCQGLNADGLPHGFKFSPSGRVVLDNDVTPNID